MGGWCLLITLELQKPCGHFRAQGALLEAAVSQSRCHWPWAIYCRNDRYAFAPKAGITEQLPIANVSILELGKGTFRRGEGATLSMENAPQAPRHLNLDLMNAGCFRFPLGRGLAFFCCSYDNVLTVCEINSAITFWAAFYLSPWLRPTATFYF